MTTQRSTFLRFALIALSGVLFTAAAASATLWVRVSDENLVRQTVDRGGVIVEVEAADWSPAYDASVASTDQRMLVRRVIQGDLSGAEELMVRWLGGETASGYALKIHGVEPLAAGSTAVLFLRPGSDGTWHALHLFQGIFQTVLYEGNEYAFRILGGVELDLSGKILSPDGDKLAGEAERARDLNSFVDWIRGIADGRAPVGDYWRDVSLDALRATADELSYEKFTLFPDPIRWRQFDTNSSIPFRAHEAGQPGLSGGGFNEFQSAIGTWNNDPGSNVRYTYAGTTTSTMGFKDFDGINAIVFDDLDGAGEFEDPFSCSQGGVIAVGGPWVGNARHTFQGTSYLTAFGADIITNQNTDCILRVSATARETFGHELGHTLGLSHSCGDDNSGSCNGRPLQDDALMRASVHADGRGARLNADDRAGINLLYPSGAQLPPDAPSGLSASNGGFGVVNLSWTDNSNNENGFQVERRLGTGSFSQIFSSSSNVRTFQDSAAPTGSSVGYRVRAFNGAGSSAYSNTVQITTSGPVPPSNLVVTSLSADALRVDWTDNTANETAFEIQIRRSGSFQFATVATASPGVTSTTFDELFSGSAFDFRVRALTPLGNSSWSQAAGGSTQPYPVGEPCEDGFSTLCLNGGRFQNRILWREFTGEAGFGNRIEADLSTDSGLFWFFGIENWELLVKNLDGCGVNQAFWVFSAATTNVEYSLQVVDTWTGESVTYFNPLGTAAPAVTDIGAFPDACGVMAPFAAPASIETPAATGGPSDKNHGCTTITTGTETTLFLADGRFEVDVDWRDFNDNDGPGRVVEFCSEDSGLFWFFGLDNWELLVKVLDACTFNDHYWVFSAATTNVEYTLTVTDTQTGVSKTYFNPLGQASEAVTDTSAFATCP